MDAAANTSGSLPTGNEVVDAFTNAELPNSDFLELFASTPPRLAQAAILRCRILYRTLAVKAMSLAEGADTSSADAAFEGNLAYLI